MNGDIHIVPMSREHLAPLGALERLCFSRPWSETALAAELTKKTAVFLTAVSPQGGVVGYCGLDAVPPEGYIANVAVAPNSRRRGVGRRLVEALLVQAAARGCRTISLEVRQSNEAAVGLYTQLGFAVVGKRRDFYRDPREDALMMTWEAP